MIWPARARRTSGDGHLAVRSLSASNLLTTTICLPWTRHTRACAICNGQMPKKLLDFLDKLSGQANMVGPGRLELPTSRLSGVRSNHLSYGPLPAAVVQTVRHPKRKRNEGGGCRLCMHDRDLTDPVFVLMKGYESVAIFLA